MVKFFLLTAFLTISNMATAQDMDNVIWDIYGAKFGDSYESTASNIQRHMDDVYESMGSLARSFPMNASPQPITILGSIQYMRYGHSSIYFTFYDVVFDFLNFYFTSNSETPCFQSALFSIECDSKKKAKIKYNEVLEKFSKHFTLYPGKDQNGDELYVGGKYYKYDEKCAFMIRLRKEDKKTIYLYFRDGGF